MPGADSRYIPPSASDSSASDEASNLEIHLQKQLEEDVARIFDESIYTDLEVVCGKLKILTHSCILKARTNKFYHKLETILHLNFGRNTFDEIYSFISDTYTECNIKKQEEDVLQYLNALNSDSLKLELNNKQEQEPEEFFTPKCTHNNEQEQAPEEFLTPKCTSPLIEKALKTSLSSSPSTELTKEYYALVPIEKKYLEKELIEQDVLSSAFQSIISSQSGDSGKIKNLQRNKPTSLALTSSHTSKSFKHSNSCDILNKGYSKAEKLTEIDSEISAIASQNIILEKKIETNHFENLKNCQLATDKNFESFSPDSLIIDDPSSSSDYLSAAYTCTSGVVSACQTQFNVGDHIINMENIFTSSDSGLENTGLLESLSSHKDVTITDLSLTESNLHDLTNDGSNSHDSVSSPLVEKRNIVGSKTKQSISMIPSDTNIHSDQSNKHKDHSNCNSSKEEKQRQNEEIVILESSSLSSETGSWESVFPPKLAIKEACENLIQNERQNFNEIVLQHDKKKCFSTDTSSLVQKSPVKSTPCFIDAASLADEDATSSSAKLLKAIEKLDENEISTVTNQDVLLHTPSQPVPCSNHRSDISPNDWSENNEDSLEQMDNKDPDSIQKDLSPTIFEMTPITEDSLCTNDFEAGSQEEHHQNIPTVVSEKSSNAKKEDFKSSSNTVFMSDTPHNSIMSLKTSVFKQYECEYNESHATLVGADGQISIKSGKKYNESSPIISGGASVEDHLPTIGSFTNSPLTRRRIENAPIVSGAYIPPLENEKTKSTRPACAPSWIVDMSAMPKIELETNTSTSKRKPSDKSCDNLRNCSKFSSSLENCSKSRSSVDSDSSERSSHKFYIDLSSLPDPITPKNNKETESVNEKKNMFSMYIDISERPKKEAPSRLSSLSAKKNSVPGTKSTPKNKIKYSYESTVVSSKEVENIYSPKTFEKYESLCENPNMSISEIIGLNDNNRQKELKDNKDLASNESIKACGNQPNITGERSTPRNFQPMIQEEDELFVKLSDLDKPVQKLDASTTLSRVDKTLDERMTRSIPENNWSDPNQTAACRSNEVITSFHSENALSLNRLFPHLKNEFSRSMPGSLSSRTRSPLRLGVSSSPGDIEDQISDNSDMSVQSSFCRSIVENSTTEETSQASSLIGNCQSRLGQDLLRMFLEEIAPDVIVEVSGRRIKAHKCILSSRCQYFAGILSGGWVESSGNVIILPPFSFNVVHFALCHIYSGVSTIPDSISIVELATLADMLGLEGLKEAIMFTLKAKYCHHFHKPCAVCTAGVLECFPLSSVYGLDDLYRKCLKWITKHFSRVWPTKAFATLPVELLEKCYQQIVVNMTFETIVETVMGCGITVDALHNSRWAEVVARMCRRLVHAAAHFVAPKLVTLLREIGTLPADPPRSAMQALEDCVGAAIEWAPPEECCRAYALLAGVAREIRNYRFAKPELITKNNSNGQGQDNLLYVHANSWLLQCEGALVRAAPRVCCTQAFMDLPSDLRRRLRELGCIMYGGQPQMAGQPERLSPGKRSRSSQLGTSSKTPASTSKSLEIDQMRASFVPYTSKPTTQLNPELLKTLTISNDQKKACRNVPPKVRTTKAQEERAKFNMSKTNLSQERLNTKPSAKTCFENTKPRYLEPRPCKDDTKKTPNKKFAPKIISSSESSRNSSPIQARNLRTSRMKIRQVSEAKTQGLSKDSLATFSQLRTSEPSTDSLSESYNNIYATYTKVKHTTKGSVECEFAVKGDTKTTNNGRRTKIPVYLNQVSRTNNAENKSNVESQKKQNNVGKMTASMSNSSSSMPMRKENEKNSFRSLMSATKSSSAKMVNKVLKDSPQNKSTPKNNRNSSQRNQRRGEIDPPPEIPIMERSGTFLKDEPTFGDKTTNIDLDP